MPHGHTFSDSNFNPHHRKVVTTLSPRVLTEDIDFNPHHRKVVTY